MYNYRSSWSWDEERPDAPYHTITLLREYTTITASDSTHVAPRLRGHNILGLDSYLAEIADARKRLKKKHNLGEEYFRESIQKPYLSHLIKILHDRCEDKSIMAAIDIVNPAKLPPGIRWI